MDECNRFGSPALCGCNSVKAVQKSTQTQSRAVIFLIFILITLFLGRSSWRPGRIGVTAYRPSESSIQIFQKHDTSAEVECIVPCGDESGITSTVQVPSMSITCYHSYFSVESLVSEVARE